MQWRTKLGEPSKRDQMWGDLGVAGDADCAALFDAVFWLSQIKDKQKEKRRSIQREKGIAEVVYQRKEGAADGDGLSKSTSANVFSQLHRRPEVIQRKRQRRVGGCLPIAYANSSFWD